MAAMSEEAAAALADATSYFGDSEEEEDVEMEEADVIVEYPAYSVGRVEELMHAHAKRYLTHIQTGGLDLFTGIEVMGGSVGTDPFDDRDPAAKKRVDTREKVFEGVIGLDERLSTPANEIRHSPHGTAPRHSFVLEGAENAGICFQNDNKFAAIPKAFHVKFRARRIKREARDVYQVTELEEIRASRHGQDAIVQLVSHITRRAVFNVKKSMIDAGYDWERDLMLYTPAAEQLYCMRQIEMAQYKASFGRGARVDRKTGEVRGTYRDQFALLMEILDCIQWKEDAKKDLEYKRQWEEVFYSCETNADRDAARRSEISSLYERFKDEKPPLPVMVARHPMANLYFTSPERQALRALYSDDVLMGVYVEQVWSLYDDIVVGSENLDRPSLYDTAFGACFHDEYSNTFSSYGSEYHMRSFTLADIMSFPTEYSSVYGKRVPIPLPEVSFASLASLPSVCERLGTDAVMEVLVYNLLKQGRAEDQHSCLPIYNIIQRMDAEMFGIRQKKDYLRLRNKYDHQRHPGNEKKRAILSAKCVSGFGKRHVVLSTKEGHRHTMCMAAIGRLVNKGIVFLEHASVAKIHRARQVPNKEGIILEEIGNEEVERCRFIEAKHEDVEEVMRCLRDDITALYWKERMKFRVYLKDMYLLEEMFVYANAEVASRSLGADRAKPYPRNVFYAHANKMKWSREEVQKYAGIVNAMLSDREEAFMVAAETGTLESMEYLLAEKCAEAGMERVSVSDHDLSPDQKLAFESARLGYGPVVMRGIGGTGKTNVIEKIANETKGGALLACTFMNSQCTNVQRVIGGAKSAALTLDRAMVIHDMTCRNPYMLDVIDETAYYKKDALTHLSVYGFVNQITDYDKCIFEHVKTLFIDEAPTIPLDRIAPFLYAAVTCGSSIDTIYYAGDLNQLNSVMPGSLSDIFLGIGHVTITSKWRYNDRILMANVDAIAANKPSELRLAEYGSSEDTSECPAVLIQCHSSWKKAYYGNFADDAVRLLVRDFEAGLLPADRTLVVTPSNKMAEVINAHLDTSILKKLAQSEDPVISERAMDDLTKYGLDPHAKPVYGKKKILLQKGEIYRGQRVISKRSMESIGVPNHYEMIVGDEIQFLILHIPWQHFATLQTAFFDAICAEVVAYLREDEERLEGNLSFHVLVKNMVTSKNKKYAAIVTSRSLKATRAVIEEHSKTHRFEATAIANMLSAGMSKKKVNQYLSCGGSGAPSYIGVSDAHWAPSTVEQRLFLHSYWSAEWKYRGGEAATTPPEDLSSETALLTDLLQGRELYKAAVENWIKSHNIDPKAVEFLTPLLRRMIKRVCATLFRETMDEEGLRIAERLEKEVRNSFITDRQDDERPPQAALRLALEDFYVSRAGTASAVGPSDYIAVMPANGHPMHAHDKEIPIVRFRKLYEAPLKNNGPSGKIIYFPATAGMLANLSSAIAQTCFTSQSQERDVVAVVMPSRQTRNWFFAACTRGKKAWRIYSSRSVIDWTMSTEPHTRYSVETAKLRYRIPTVFEEVTRGTPRMAAFEAKCKKLEKRHKTRLKVCQQKGESEEDALLRLTRHARDEPFVGPSASGLPHDLGQNNRWMIEEMASNGDVLFRPNGLPCNVVGVTLDQAADDSLWETEMREEGEWSRVRKTFASDRHALKYIANKKAAS